MWIAAAAIPSRSTTCFPRMTRFDRSGIDFRLCSRTLPQTEKSVPRARAFFSGERRRRGREMRLSFTDSQTEYLLVCSRDGCKAYRQNQENADVTKDHADKT